MGGNASTLTPDQITHNVQDEPKRQQVLDSLYQKAQTGDPAALKSLQDLSGVGQAGVGAATNDAKNYGRMLLDQMGGNYSYMDSGDGNFMRSPFVHTVGDILKVAAPVGAAFIPGIGPVAAGAIGALGNSAGQVLSGDKFSPGEALLGGIGAGAGKYAMQGGFSHLFGGGGAGAAGAASGAAGAAGAAPAAVAGAGSLAPLTGLAGSVAKYAPLALGAMGALNQASQQTRADQQQQTALNMASQDYAQRQPYRAAGIQALNSLPTQGPDLGPLMADPGNPYYRPPQPQMGRIG